MMANQILPVNQLDQVGVVFDSPASGLPANAFSNARNVRFKDGAVSKMEGDVILNDITNKDATLNTIYGSSGNTLGAAKYVAYWSNPNLGDLAAYYVYIMSVFNSAGAHIADRAYLLDEEGNEKDITPPNLVNGGNYKGFDPAGVWQHTLFTGGFAIILNNGVDKPHYILDTVNNVVLNDVPVLSELPGWDSYNVNIKAVDLTYETALGTVFNLGQKINFANYYIKVTIGTTNYTAVTGAPSGTNATNTATFVPGALPANLAGLAMNANEFEIYNDAASDTTSIAITTLNANDKVLIEIVSRNPVDVRCGVVRSFGNLLVAGDLVEVDSSTSTVIRRLTGVVRTSDIAITGTIPNNWNPFAGGASTADEFTLSDTNTIQDMRSIQGSLYIYTTSSIHSMSLTNNVLAPVRFTQVTDSYGAITTGAIVEYDGKHLVVGSNDIFSFPGHPANIESVAQGKVRAYFYDNLNPLHETKLFTILNKAQDEIWICYPTLNSITGECDEALIWNYRQNNWTLRDLNGVISGDVAPIKGGGIPLSTISLPSGGSGNDTELNLGQAEVQTLTLSGKMLADHAGIKQKQAYTLPTQYPFTTQRPEEIAFSITGDTGPSTAVATFDIRIAAASNTVVTDANATDTVFVRNDALGGGLVIEMVAGYNGANTSVVRIEGSAVYPTNTGATYNVTTFLDDLVFYINNTLSGNSSHPLHNYTASKVDKNTNNFVLRLTSTVTGTRSLATLTALVYSGSTVALTGANVTENTLTEGVRITTTEVASTRLGYLWPTQADYNGYATDAAAAAAGVPDLRIPFYDSTFPWNDLGTTGTGDSDGHVSAKDSINQLQVFVGGWTTGGAGASFPASTTATYTVARTGPLYFILTGSGGSGADHNHGGGSGGAAGGNIAVQLGDEIEVTAGAGGPRDTYDGSGAGHSGRLSKIVWKRAGVTLATIQGNGGGGPTNGSTAAGGSVTPTTTPAGITNYWFKNGEGSTTTTNSGEGNRGGNRNGGRGVFSWYMDTLNLTRTTALSPSTTSNTGNDSRTYRGRYSASSLDWKTEYAGYGDGTQSHSDNPRCCTWNATPPGAVWLWQEGVSTDFLISNERTTATHYQQEELSNFALDADPTQVLATLASGSSATINIRGTHTNLDWSASQFGTQLNTQDTGAQSANVVIYGLTFEINNGATRYVRATNNTSKDITVNSITVTDTQGTVTTFNTAGSNVGVITANGGQDQWNISNYDIASFNANVTHTINTGTGVAIGSTLTETVAGSGVFGLATANAPAITLRFVQTNSAVPALGFTIDIETTKNLTTAEDIVNDIVTKLKATTQFAGVDPTLVGSTQPTGAQYYVERNVGNSQLTIKGVTDSDIDSSTLTITELTKVGTTEYSETHFGGALAITSTNIDGSATGNVPPTIRITFDQSSIDMRIVGDTVTQPKIANDIAQVLGNTGTFTGTIIPNGGGAGLDTIVAEREISGASTGLIAVNVLSDPSGLLDVATAGTFIQTVAGVNPSAGQGSMNLTIPASAFLPAQTVNVPVVGAYNASTTTGVILTASDLAALIRATAIPNYVLGGTGADVTFTAATKIPINRLDNGLGTGAVQTKLWSLTHNDDNGLFAITSDPLQDATAVETTPGIRVRYSQPTVIRVQYSDNSFQDYVFGGTANGPLALSTSYVPTDFSGGSGSAVRTNTGIIDTLRDGIQIIGGRTLSVQDTATTLRVSPIQYSTTGLFIQNLSIVQLGTTAPSTLTAAVQTSIPATLNPTVSSFGRFDPDRPWASDQVKGGALYPIFIRTNNANTADSTIIGADIGFKFNADPSNNIDGSEYVSFVERQELAITPELDVEELVTTALQAEGGTATELNGTLNYPTLYMRATPTNYTGAVADLLGGASLTNDYLVTQDYKVDTRVTGRFLNYRIDDAGPDPLLATNSYAWKISTLQFEINKGGPR